MRLSSPLCVLDKMLRLYSVVLNVCETKKCLTLRKTCLQMDGNSVYLFFSAAVMCCECLKMDFNSTQNMLKYKDCLMCVYFVHFAAVRRDAAAYMLLMIVSFVSIVLLITLILTQNQ